MVRIALSSCLWSCAVCCKAHGSARGALIRDTCSLQPSTGLYPLILLLASSINSQSTSGAKRRCSRWMRRVDLGVAFRDFCAESRLLTFSSFLFALHRWTSLPRTLYSTLRVSSLLLRCLSPWYVLQVFYFGALSFSRSLSSPTACVPPEPRIFWLHLVI